MNKKTNFPTEKELLAETSGPGEPLSKSEEELAEQLRQKCLSKMMARRQDLAAGREIVVDMESRMTTRIYEQVISELNKDYRASYWGGHARDTSHSIVIKRK
jgi:hypothetical protein